MRCAVVDPATGNVLNIIEADPEKDRLDGALLILSDTASPGWIWDGTTFYDPTPPPVVVPRVIIPKTITRRQCALQLRVAGMITIQEAKDMTKTGTPPASIQAYFDTMPAEQKDLAEIDFAAINYYRDNPLITALMTANGLTETDIDNFFIAAALL
jgi:hypothetical protein